MGQSNEKPKDNDTRVYIGDLHRKKKNRGVYYNVSEFLRQHTDPAWAAKVDNFTRLLDSKVHIDPKHPKYAHIYNGIDVIITRIVERLIAINPRIFQGAILHQTGSASSNVKVGLPHEADYIIELPEHSQPAYLKLNVKMFNEIIENIINTESRALLAGLDHWKINGHYRHSTVGLCLIMQCPSMAGRADSELAGVTVDIVPVFPVYAETDGVEFTPKAKAYLSRGLEQYIQSDKVFQLIGKWGVDTGVIENAILRDLSLEQKRAFRVVKYLLQTFIIRYEVFEFADESLSEEAVLKLYGFKPIIRSYWLRMLLFSLLQSIHGTEEAERLNHSGLLAICLLDMVKYCKDLMDTELKWDSIDLPHPLIKNMKGVEMEFPEFFLSCHADWVMGFFVKDDPKAFIADCNLINGQNTPLNIKYPRARKDPMFLNSDSDSDSDWESPVIAQLRREVYYGTIRDRFS